jgi:hypothetical protein
MKPGRCRSKLKIKYLLNANPHQDKQLLNSIFGDMRRQEKSNHSAGDNIKGAVSDKPNQSVLPQSSQSNARTGSGHGTNQ